MKKRLAQLDENHAEIRLIDCVEESGRPNLAITSLEPEEGIRAAGVQWRMQVTVQNYGLAAVRKVPVIWSADGKPGGSVFIDAIPPGRSEQKTFDVSFAVAGEHAIEANLDADAVNTDNNRYAVVDLPVATPVLLVDGQRPAANSKRIADALTARKGIQPEIVSPDYLSAPKRPLDDFAMICVTNVGKIERSGVEALEKYVEEGGGVFFVTGPLTRGEYVNQDLYRNGKGLFPVPLAATGAAGGRSAGQYARRAIRGPLRFPQYGAPRREPVEDFRAAVFCRAERLERQERSGRAGDHAASQRRAAVGGEELWPRPGAGLPFDHRSTTGKWNNWSSAEAFLRGLRAQYGPLSLASVRGGRCACWWANRRRSRSTLLPSSRRSIFPVPGAMPRRPRSTATSSASGKDQRTVTYTKTETAGFYKALLTQPSHKTEIRNFAVNVDPAEGDLRALTGPDLASRLAPLKYEFEYAAKYDTKLDETQGRNLGDSLLLVLLIVLIVEQLFAWSCGYHVSSRMTNPWNPGSQSRPLKTCPTLTRKEARHDFLRIVAAGRSARPRRNSSSGGSSPTTIGGSTAAFCWRSSPRCSGSTAAIRASCPGISASGLPLLRTLVLIGLLVVYLQPRWRSEREEHFDSRVLMLVDTSLSMARLDPDTPGGHAGQTRLQQVAAGLDDTEFLARLRKKHQVTVVPFNSVLENDRRVVLPLEAPPADGNGAAANAARTEPLRAVRGKRQAGRGAARLGASSSCPAAPKPAWARPWNSSCARSGARRFPGSCWSATAA